MPRLAQLTSFADDAPILQLGPPHADGLFDGPERADAHALTSIGYAGRLIAW